MSSTGLLLEPRATIDISSTEKPPSSSTGTEEPTIGALTECLRDSFFKLAKLEHRKDDMRVILWNIILVALDDLQVLEVELNMHLHEEYGVDDYGNVTSTRAQLTQFYVHLAHLGMKLAMSSEFDSYLSIDKCIKYLGSIEKEENIKDLGAIERVESLIKRFLRAYIFKFTADARNVAIRKGISLENIMRIKINEWNTEFAKQIRRIVPVEGSASIAVSRTTLESLCDLGQEPEAIYLIDALLTGPGDSDDEDERRERRKAIYNYYEGELGKLYKRKKEYCKTFDPDTFDITKKQRAIDDLAMRDAAGLYMKIVRYGPDYSRQKYKEMIGRSALEDALEKSAGQGSQISNLAFSLIKEFSYLSSEERQLNLRNISSRSLFDSLSQLHRIGSDEVDQDYINDQTFNDMQCPISLCEYVDPVILSDGLTIERSSYQATMRGMVGGNRIWLIHLPGQLTL